MKIAISGPHGQGKTTLISSLKLLSEFNNFKFVSSPTRSLPAHLSINEKGTQDTQTAIMYQHYINQLDDNVVLDRCALDGIAYSLIFKNVIDSNVLNSLMSLYRYLIKQYNLIFFTGAEIPLQTDGVRSTNQSFFNQVVGNFNKIIKDDTLNVIFLTGSNEQRVRTVIETIQQYKQQ